jgi:hypothetical protein
VNDSFTMISVSRHAYASFKRKYRHTVSFFASRHTDSPNLARQSRRSCTLDVASGESEKSRTPMLSTPGKLLLSYHHGLVIFDHYSEVMREDAQECVTALPSKFGLHLDGQTFPFLL